MTAEQLTADQHLERIKGHGRDLAAALSAASDAGVSPALILPQLMLIFRGQFGQPPAELLAQIAKAQQ